MRYDFLALLWLTLLVAILLGWSADRAYLSAQHQEFQRAKDHSIAELDEQSPELNADNERLLNRLETAKWATPWTGYLAAVALFGIVGFVVWGVMKGKLHPSILEIGRRK